MCIFHKQEKDMRLHLLSSFVNDHSQFLKFAQTAYFITEHICKDYPKYFEWFWAKAIPRVFNGTGEIVICTIDNNVAGTTLLKKEKFERKISTIFVVEGYRGKHVASNMLECAYKYLGTSKPLITISEHKLLMFEHIIRKYNWELTSIMDKGYYTNFSREFVFNGELEK